MKTTLLAAAFALAASVAMAQDATQALIDQFQADGYTHIEVKRGTKQIKIEAIKGTEKIEIIIDAATGAVVKREVGTVEAGDDTTPGVSDDGSDDDNGTDDHDDDDDDGDDDNSGHGGGDDDNSGHGGGGNSGSGSDD